MKDAPRELAAGHDVFLPRLGRTRHRTRRLAQWISLTLVLGGAGSLPAAAEKSWTANLSKPVVVQTVVNPANPAEKFLITRSILPAGVPGPEWTFPVKGHWEKRSATTTRPQAYYGLRDKDGHDFLPPDRPYVFVLPEQGVLFGWAGGEKGDEIRAQEFVHWGYKSKLDRFRYKVDTEEQDEWGIRVRAQLLPIGTITGGAVPGCEALVVYEASHLRIFDGVTGKLTLDVQPRNCVSPERAELLPRVYDYFASIRKSEVRYFRLGSLLAFFDGDTLRVLDQKFRQVAQYSGVKAQRTYVSPEPRSPETDPWFLLQESPQDPGLYWILQADGKFAPPPGSLGVVPLNFITKYPGQPRFAGDSFYHHYRRQCTGWLVAGQTNEGRRWALASANLSETTPFQYRSFHWVDSHERKFWNNYSGPTPQYLALESAEDGKWAVLDGSMVPGVDPTGDIATWVAATEAREEAINESDKLLEGLAAAKWEETKQQERALQAARYNRAVAAGDHDNALDAAKNLGPDGYWTFLCSPLATEADFKEAKAKGTWSPEREAALAAQLKAYLEIHIAEYQERLAAEKEAKAIAAANAARRHREEWADWTAKQHAAAAANLKAVHETEYNHAMENYRRGLSDSLPNR